MLFFSIICLVVMIYVVGELVYGYRSLGTLAEIELWRSEPAPLVSVIVPACNEETSIAAGVRSLIDQGYPRLEIIVVNDRSTDRTAAVIERVRKENAEKGQMVKVVDIRELPVGWLGKTHALHCGAQAARGEFLLFTDADVWLEKTVISRAVRAMSADGLDHLSVIFQNRGGGLLLNALIIEVGAALLLLFKPWRIGRGGSRYFFGVGAFNMVRTSIYRALGGHRRIRMQIVDDVFLGKIIKWGGYRQKCLLAHGLVRVPWYATVTEMISGLMKNVYALFYYRLYLVLAAMLLLILFVIMPVWLIFVTTGIARILFLAAVLIRMLGCGAGMMTVGLPFRSVLCLLLTPYLCLYIIGRAVLLTHRARGIVWRDSFYPLDLLRKQEWLFSGLLRCRRCKKKSRVSRN